MWDMVAALGDLVWSKLTGAVLLRLQCAYEHQGTYYNAEPNSAGLEQGR